MNDPTFNLTELVLIMLGPLAALAAVVYRFVIKPKAAPAPAPTTTPLSDNLAAREATRAETIRESDAKATAPADGPPVDGSNADTVRAGRDWLHADNDD